MTELPIVYIFSLFFLFFFFNSIIHLFGHKSKKTYDKLLILEDTPTTVPDSLPTKKCEPEANFFNS